jgi:hypothetical protein
MRWLSLFLACQRLSSGTNLRECEDQSWFKVQAVPVFRFDWCKIFSLTPRGSYTPGWRPLPYPYGETNERRTLIITSQHCNISILAAPSPCNAFPHNAWVINRFIYIHDPARCRALPSTGTVYSYTIHAVCLCISCLPIILCIAL